MVAKLGRVSICFAAFVGAIAVLAAATPGSLAATKYDNGSPNDFTGLNFTLGEFSSADDFTLGSAGTINSATIYYLSFYGSNIASFNYGIFADGGSNPTGSALASGTAQNIAESNIGTLPGHLGGSTQVDFDFETGFMAQVGISYWLVLSDATGTGTYFWSTTGSQTGSVSAARSVVSAVWGSFESDLAFQLHEEVAPVPLPPAVLLLGTALAGMAGFNRLKRRKQSDEAA